MPGFACLYTINTGIHPTYSVLWYSAEFCGDSCAPRAKGSRASVCHSSLNQQTHSTCIWHILCTVVVLVHLFRDRLHSFIAEASHVMVSRPVGLLSLPRLPRTTCGMRHRSARLTILGICLAVSTSVSHQKRYNLIHPFSPVSNLQMRHNSFSSSLCRLHVQKDHCVEVDLVEGQL